MGQELASIPIQARCAVPAVTFEPSEMVDFGEIFIRYPSHETLVLHNTSALPAKFQILPQDEQTRLLAEFEPDQLHGSVPPASSHVVTLTLTAKMIGPLQIPMYVRILGHNNTNQFMLTATSIGPIVIVEPSTVDWGNVKCLEPVTRHVRLTNDSVIEAHVRGFMKAKQSLWTVEPKNIQLKPQETVSVAMTLKIDETSKISDIMHLLVTEGKDIQVTTKAKGISTPVTCKDNLETVDFGTQYTTQTIIREFLIENRGRKPRKLVWSSDTAPTKKSKSPETISSSTHGMDDSGEVPVFSVSPDTLVLDGKCAYKFHFVALCPIHGEVMETLTCLEFIGNDRKGSTVFKTKLHGNFVAPLLQLSSTTINFKFLWDINTPIAPMQQMLEITNVSPLDVRCSLKVLPPFTANIDTLSLRPSERAGVKIEFDPGFKVDRVCGIAKQKLTISYHDHPQKDHVHLVGEVIFPNITLSAEKLDFGALLNQTTKQMTITITNHSLLPVNYQWMFVEEQEMQPGEYERAVTGSVLEPSICGDSALPTPMAGTAGSGFGFGRRASSHPPPTVPEQITQNAFLDTGMQGSEGSLGSTPGALGPGIGTGTGSVFGGGTGSILLGGGPASPTALSSGQKSEPLQLGRPHVDINQIFDIMPIMGHLEPGGSCATTFAFFGLNNQMFEAIALCQVEGGPEYEVQLKGQASKLEYKLDKTELDFGDVLFNAVLEREIYLHNTGRVPYHFNTA